MFPDQVAPTVKITDEAVGEEEGGGGGGMIGVAAGAAGAGLALMVAVALWCVWHRRKRHQPPREREFFIDNLLIRIHLI